MTRYLPGILLCCLFLALAIPTELQAQRKKKKQAEPTVQEEPIYRDALFHGLRWRNVGPFRGGRSTAVCGVPSQTSTYYMGTTGGGLWKTTNAGSTWRNISDGFFKTGSVGAVAVAPSDPNVIYVGMGEAPIRGVMTSHGDGVYKSTDGGRTWQHMGLDRVRQIPKVRIHPRNPDWVYVAAQGSPYEPTKERGIYRSKDGGQNWELVLHVDERSGASDLSMDASNPRILYAAFWDHQRLPWQMVSGGEGSSIWKSEDGGDTWTKLTEGLPDVIMGKIGVSVSPANPQRVWAIIESDKGGLYRSDNGGKNWKLINPDRVLRARSWYYMHVFADSKDAETVYVLNAPVMKSTDGGKSFKPLPTPHGDNHDLWIHPDNNQVMINGNDGGSNISFNAGKSWSIQSNQPTAQFYRINADNRFPYYLYAGQQDNSTVAIPNRTQRRGIANSDFYRVGGCESAYCAFDPDDPTHVYAGCYQGIITEYDVALKMEKDIMAYPYLGLGSIPSEVKYRFNWNAPILMSQHDKSVLYHAGNVLLKSTDRGINWEAISPDLTRNIAEHLGKGGAPITNEGAGGEVYHTIMYVAESPHDAQTLWVGTDDGLVHISRDGGQNWADITPPGMGEGIVNSIDVSTHQAGTAYIAFTRYKFNDFIPHIYQTKDYGQTWTETVKGIAAEAHVRVVRSDPAREGLLYAGTETGLYISFDNGGQWLPFQRNLPVVPITDMKVHQNDLLVSTQGRAFWALDDLTPLHNWKREMADEIHFFAPRDPYLFGGPRIDSMPDQGTNPDFGAVLHYYLPEMPDSLKQTVKVEILDADGNIMRTYSSDKKKKSEKASAKTGLNKCVWNLQRNPVQPPKGNMVLGGGSNHHVVPGSYTARLIHGEDSLSHSFTLKPDPRLKATAADWAEKGERLSEMYHAVEEIYKWVGEMRHVKKQIQAYMERLEDQEELKQSGKELIAEIDSLEAQLVQNQQKTFQDVINFPNQLDAKLVHIQGLVDESVPPLTQGQKARTKDLMTEWKEMEQQVEMLLGEKLEAWNSALQNAAVPHISRKEK